METQITKGKWQVFKKDDDLFIVAIASIQGGVGNVEDEANAKLIAASPELLKACNFALQGIKRGQVDNITIQVLEDAISLAVS